MTQSPLDSFFNTTAADGPERDRYGRPMLFPRGETEKKQAYTRASSLSDYLADFSHIWKWKMRYLARSMGYNRDLAMLAASECYTTGFDKGDDKENKASGRRLDEIIERALDRQGISEKADYGTAIHAWTEPGNDGFVFPEAVTSVASYADKKAELGIVEIATELFCANDDLMVAGTFDGLFYVPGFGICIGDKKTSKEVHGNDFRIQLSVYANADLYDWETDKRMSLEEFIEARGWDPALLNRHDGFIFHIEGPKIVKNETIPAKTTVVRLDLTKGYEAAHHAAWVRDNHRKGKHVFEAESLVHTAYEQAQLDLHADIAEAKTLDDLNVIWENPVKRAAWTAEHTVRAKALRAEIEEAA